MANEELNQRGYLETGQLKGETFGSFERFNLGSTSLSALWTAGLRFDIPNSIAFEPSIYKMPKSPGALKPDQVYARRVGSQVVPVAVNEHKKPYEFSGPGGEQRLRSAQEQALASALALGVEIAVTTDGIKTSYLDVMRSRIASRIITYDEARNFTPGTLEALITGSPLTPVDPTPLAERVWQLIWHATKAEPKECLLTFVEIFMLKFLTDNLPSTVLPSSMNFYSLIGDPVAFKSAQGKSEIEFYVEIIRPKIKSIFPDNTVSSDPKLAQLFGMQTIVSKTSIINGFVFLQSGSNSIDSYNSVFKSVIQEFNDFGPLSSIDPEFKVRLYETFLRRSARQQRLGQFFTPRNVVKPLVAMAQLAKLPAGSTVLDPAAGVGGFVLEPLIWDEALKDNLSIADGHPTARVRTVGIDVDSDLHILAKANMLLHHAELIRNPSTTMPALNKAMADAFILMNDSQTLGSLLQPPVDSIDVILTNPPYVTRGSAIYKDALRDISGPRNGKILREYYGGAGLGVEALFLRYISGALKPGGRAFVIVPQGMLNRTDAGPKQQLLEECNILASIQLPRNTFFNTAQKTYVLVIQKRHTASDSRPRVMCGIARSIGESLDWRRTPEPEKNDLEDISKAFIMRDEGQSEEYCSSNIVKFEDADAFSANDRWDVVRFWSDDELVLLGESSPPVERALFIEETRASLDQLRSDLEAVATELDDLTSSEMKTLRLSDRDLFSIHSGTRIRTQDIKANPPLHGEDSVTVFSCFKNPYITKGEVSRTWLRGQTRVRRGSKEELPAFPLESAPSVTVNANGASVGKVFVRPADCLLTDDVIAVTPAASLQLDLEYMAYALQRAVTAGGFLYEAKLFASRVSALEVEVPVNLDGSLDLGQQVRIASAHKRFQSILERLADMGKYSAEARLI